MARSLVVVVDDDEAVLAMVSALPSTDCELLTCRSPAAADAALAGRQPDVALVDHHLGPGIPSGLDYLIALGERAPACWRVLFSGDYDPRLLVEAINRGHVDAFLAKPLRNDQFQLALRQGASTARLRRDNRTLVDQLADRNGQLEAAKRRLEMAVAERTQHLEEANRRLREKQHELVRLETQSAVAHLVRGLAHELNNPLAAILGFAQRLQRRFDGDVDARDRLGVIVSEVDRCRNLVEQLRRLAAPLDEAIGRCQPAQLLRQAALRLAEAGRRPPRIATDDPLPMVLAAPRSLERVFEQVLDNALQAGATQIILAAHEGDDRVQLFVDNDGDPPTAEVVANAVKPFFTTRSTSGGRGLGLTIAASLLRDQGGTLVLDRHPRGSGARVTIALPAAKPSSDRLPTRPAQPPLVLVVDDEPLIAELLQDCLLEAGCAARTVPTCAGALEVLAHEPVRAVLADVNLTDGSGVDLLTRAVAKRPELAGHVALVTGDAQAHERVRRETGLPVLAKPFRLEQMAEFIAKLV